MRLALAALLVLGLMVACGTRPAPESGADAGLDASAPAADAGPVDAGLTAGPDAGAPDAGTPPPDAGEVDAGPVACNTLTARKCVVCCGEMYPAAYESFTQIVLPCACAADLCGTPDGGSDGDAGAGDPDASTLGAGACQTTCESPTTTPNASCAKCIKQSLGSQSAPGTCGSVAGECAMSSTCNPFLQCIQTCH